AYLNGCNEFFSPANSSGASGGSGQGSVTGANAAPADKIGSGNTSDSGLGGETTNNPGEGPGNGPSNGSPDGAVGASQENALDVYVGGGEPFPKNGLESLGLATAGVAAVSAMKAYAKTTKNDLITARHAVNGLKSGKPTSAGVGAVVGALSTLASDYAALANQAKKWDINSFDEKARPGARKGQSDLETARQNALTSASDLARSLAASSSPGQISNVANAIDAVSSDISALSAEFDAIELTDFTDGQAKVIKTAQSNLQKAANSVSALSPRLKAAVNTPRVKTTAAVVGGLLTQGLVVDAIYFFTRPDNPLSPKAVPPIVAASDDEDAPSEWYINTVPGTSVKAFQEWIKGLPDRGLGRQYVYDGANFQSYVGKWTREQAIIIHENAIVSHQVPNIFQEVHLNAVQSNASWARKDFVQRRDEDESPEIVADQDNVLHLSMLSMPKGEDWGDLLADAAADGKPYIYEKSAGSGITVYILDSGINWEHQDPNHNWKGTDGPRMMSEEEIWEDEPSSSGVRVIASARILELADLIVYLRQFDLLRNNRHAEYAYQPPYNIPRPVQSDPWVDVLAESWATGIVTVFAAGNRQEETPPYPELNRMGYWNPQRFAKPNNPMITVGSLDVTGEKSEFNVDVTAPTATSMYLGWYLVFDTICTGEISTYAMGFPITVADSADVEGVTFEGGTSFSAPQVGGLAAYLLGLPNLRRPADFRKIPMAVKKRITRTARNDPSKGGVGMAYNGAREVPCNGFVTIIPETKRRSIEDVVAGKNMIDGLVGLNVTLGEPVLPMNKGHELPVEVMVA
ncbi:MAG: hypothetical protein Q9198_002180, partial [Flavoplaca austrocitrina]